MKFCGDTSGSDPLFTYSTDARTETLSLFQNSFCKGIELMHGIKKGQMASDHNQNLRRRTILFIDYLKSVWNNPSYG